MTSRDRSAVVGPGSCPRLEGFSPSRLKGRDLPTERKTRVQVDPVMSCLDHCEVLLRKYSIAYMSVIVPTVKILDTIQDSFIVMIQFFLFLSTADGFLKKKKNRCQLVEGESSYSIYAENLASLYIIFMLDNGDKGSGNTLLGLIAPQVVWGVTLVRSFLLADRYSNEIVLKRGPFCK